MENDKSLRYDKILNQAGLSSAAPGKPNAKGLSAAVGIWGWEVSLIYAVKQKSAMPLARRGQAPCR